MVHASHFTSLMAGSKLTSVLDKTSPIALLGLDHTKVRCNPVVMLIYNKSVFTRHSSVRLRKNFMVFSFYNWDYFQIQLLELTYILPACCSGAPETTLLCNTTN